MIELVHAKLTHTYATARRLSGMPRGLCHVDVFSVSDLFEPPGEERSVEFPPPPKTFNSGRLHSHNWRSSLIFLLVFQ